MPIPFKNNIERLTLNNNNYRKVIYTTEQTQLVLMSLLPSEDIPLEIHKKTTQFIRVESGTGICYINNERYNLKDGDAIVIPQNTKHYIKATSELKLYTLYSPPEHDFDLIQKDQSN